MKGRWPIICSRRPLENFTVESVTAGVFNKENFYVENVTSCGPERESLSCAFHLGVSTSDHYPFTDGNHYPTAKVLICFWFLLILLVEAVVHKCCGHAHDKAGVVQLDMKGETWEGRRFYKDGPWILFNTISTFNIRLN